VFWFHHHSTFSPPEKKTFFLLPEINSYEFYVVRVNFSNYQTTLDSNCMCDKFATSTDRNGVLLTKSSWYVVSTFFYSANHFHWLRKKVFRVRLKQTNIVDNRTPIHYIKNFPMSTLLMSQISDT